MSESGMTFEFDGMAAVMEALNAQTVKLQTLPDIKIGVKSGIEYPDGTPVEVVGLVHELGDEELGIPERSYLRSTLDVNGEKYNKALQRILKKSLEFDSNVILDMNLLGASIASDVKETINNMSEPALADSTLAQRKGNSDSPLNDTGLLQRSIIHEVD